MNSQAVVPSSPRYVRLQRCGGEAVVDSQPQREAARKGYVPVMVGGESAVKERFLIPTKLIAHPSIVALLEMSANEFGYGQQGVLRIPCDPDCFRSLLNSVSFNKI